MSLFARTRRALAYSLVCCAVLFLSGGVFTFVQVKNTKGRKESWPSSAIPVHMVLGFVPGSGWARAAQGALDDWNRAGSNFRFTYHTTSDTTFLSLSCGNADGRNVVGFSYTNCGLPFSDALAVEKTIGTDDGTIVDSDVIFDLNRDWDLYNGPMPFDYIVDGPFDFRRVALHEFGHVLGLDHPDDHGQFVKAIMNGRGRSLATYTLQADDISGVVDIYGGTRPTSRCTLTNLGTVSGTVARSGTLGHDCVSPNAPNLGGGDGFLARFYSFRLAQEADVRIDMTSSNINSRLTLRRGANIRGSRVAADDNSGTGNNARISRRLQAGTYTIEATSANSGDTGQFRLTLTATPIRSTAGCTPENFGVVSAGRTTVRRNGTLGRDCVSPNYSGELARYYSFTLLGRSADVRIDMESSNINSWLTLRRGANIRGSQVAADDNSGTGNNARISRRLAAGTYTIETTSNARGATGTFRMTLTVAPVEDQPSQPGRTRPPTLDVTCHGYDEGPTRAYNCIPVPSQQRLMRTFVPAVGSACDQGNIAEFPAGRIVFQIRCRDGAAGRSAGWSHAGRGRASVVKPADTPRVWLRTSLSGSSAHLSVWCRAPQEYLVVNELLGASWGNDGTNGNYGMDGCSAVEVSAGAEDVQWWFTPEPGATALTPPRSWEGVSGAGRALGADALQDLAAAGELERDWGGPGLRRMNPGEVASTPDDYADALQEPYFRNAVRTSPLTLDLTCHGYNEGAARGTRAYNCIPVPSQQRYMRTFVPPVGSACDRGFIAEFPAGRIVFQIRCRDGVRAQSAAWSQSGRGAASFVKPADTPRVWVRTAFSGSSAHLSVWCRAPQEQLVINELLGRSWGNDGTNGVYGMDGCGEVEVDTGSAEDVQWSFTQELDATALWPPRSWEQAAGADDALPPEALDDLDAAVRLEKLWSQPRR